MRGRRGPHGGGPLGRLGRRAHSRPWQPDTLVNLYSIGKSLTALLAARLMGQDRLDVTAPVARYWPDPDAGLGFGYVMNLTEPGWQNPRNRALIDAVYASLA